MSKQIIVGIDIRDLKMAKTGQKTTLEELRYQFNLMEGPEFSFRYFDSKFPGYTGRNKFLIALGHLRLHTWKQIILPYKAWKEKCDIIFCVDYFVPYFHFGYKTVQVFHDAFFFEYPQHYNRLWLHIFNSLAIPAARRSSFIIAPTNYALERIHYYTNFSRDKLVAVYEGPKSLEYPVGLSQPTWFEQLEGRKYLLHVGVMEKRKNLPALVTAFKALVDAGYDDYRLVLVGQGSNKINSDDAQKVMHEIRENRLEQHVILLGYLPDEELSIVYSRAFMYVFPSYNEGFGIPVLEAFRFRLPVLVANNTCLPEVGGDAVLTFNPFDPADIFAKIRQVIDNDKLRQHLIERGTERLKFFSWKKSSEQLAVIFKKALLALPK